MASILIFLVEGTSPLKTSSKRPLPRSNSFAVFPAPQSTVAPCKVVSVDMSSPFICQGSVRHGQCSRAACASRAKRPHPDMGRLKCGHMAKQFRLECGRDFVGVGDRQIG